MVTIRTYFSEFSFDIKKEYIIYEESYEADEYGRPLPADSEEIRSGNYYEYGHIIVETERKKYIIQNVYSAYEWIVKILNYIDSNRDKDDIFINMSQLHKDRDGSFVEFECGGCVCESIK